MPSQSQLAAWEVTIAFQISGQPRFGGDGFAFWYVERPEVLGNIYGSSDYFTGLGIFIDTFNNDQKGQNPLILGGSAHSPPSSWEARLPARQLNTNSRGPFGCFLSTPRSGIQRWHPALRPQLRRRKPG